jgi:hypothetical protein
MNRRTFFALAASGFVCAQPGFAVHKVGTRMTIVNVMPTFFNFWDATSQLPESERVQAFFTTVVGSYPDLFHQGLIASGALTDLGTDPDAQRRVAAYLREVGPLIPAMRNIADSIQNSLQNYIDGFISNFPDFEPATPIYFTISLLGLTAGLRIDGPDSGLYFGVDAIARVLKGDDTLKVIFDHELFHMYHHQIVPQVTDNRAAWAYMWEEGLATFVSQRMSPGTTADQVLMLPPRLFELADPVLPMLARQMLDVADSIDASAYGDLFSLDKARPGMPARAGYYVGYKVAEKLASNRTPLQLARLQGSELKSAVRAALVSMTSGLDKHN